MKIASGYLSASKSNNLIGGNMSAFRILMAGLALTVLSSGTHAAISTFGDRATFLAAAGSVTTIDFGGIAPSGDLVEFNTLAGLTLAGVNFVGHSDIGNTLFVIDDTFCCAAYSSRGGHGASLGSPVGLDGPNPFIEVNLPGGTTAVGMDLFAVIQGDLGGSLTDTVQIGIEGDTFLVPTVTVGVGNGRVFFGFISDAPISSFTIAPTRIDTGIDVVDFAFGVVPIPAAVWLFGSALGLLGWMRRKAA